MAGILNDILKFIVLTRGVLSARDWVRFDWKPAVPNIIWQ